MTNLLVMKKTIGFSNKNNMWTSKYDYVASNYSTIDKKFFSSNKLTTSDSTIAWRHNEGSPNTFYDTAYPSTVAVSFANNPSENKIYKSMSLEGSGNFANVVNVEIPENADPASMVQADREGVWDLIYGAASSQGVDLLSAIA